MAGQILDAEEKIIAGVNIAMLLIQEPIMLFLIIGRAARAKQVIRSNLKLNQP